MTTVSGLLALRALLTARRPARARHRLGRNPRLGSTCAPPGPSVADSREGWEVAELVAALDPGIAARLLAAHGFEGWCRSCHRSAPCPTRLLAEAAALAGRPRSRPPAGRPDPAGSLGVSS